MFQFYRTFRVLVVVFPERSNSVLTPDIPHCEGHALYRGHCLHVKTYGGDGNDQIQSLEVLGDGNVLFGGFSDSDISGNKTEPNEGLEDM